MVIKNSTPWSTHDMRKLFRRCVKEVEKVERPKYPFHKKSKNFRLDILNGSACRGRAVVNGYWIMIKIPRDWALKLEYPKKPNAIDEKAGYEIYYAFNSKNSSARIPINFKGDRTLNRYYWDVVGKLDEIELEHRKKLARLMIHEYYHSIGTRCIDHKNYKNDFTKKWNVDWVKDYPIGKKEIVQQPEVDIKLQRYQRAIVNLHKADTRLKRAKTINKKWREKVRYYEKVYNFKV